MGIDTRIEALSQAVRVTLSKGGAEDDAATVARAEAYEAFITAE